ncbi:ribonuclease III [Pedobacter sp. MR2016-19]|uniref:Ribonuclease 3 n=1 Tax=Pedobacter alluvionis TaxID=475253 RepID=A0A497XTT1_9SPHI|nr:MULTISPECIES: ribonuclease III [Pedobacter]MBE5320207.1 ribonuclease III [Pedobacter sp. MR2016-19]QXU41782.1 ribonuclease III [Pedobacter sp. D749]RLJ71884.1 ribonuclease-3 [Pedobacter alluvionis]TFB28671.1 ribonuclease III [Pedobacter alluvionis]
MPILKLYKLYLSPEKEFVKKLKNILGFVPGNVTLYKMAFRHRSAAKILKNGSRSSNERLEFLGDAVLGSVIAELLFKHYPYKEEGFLTEMRSKIVNRANLNQLAKKIGFDKLIQFDQRSVSIQTKHNSMLGDAFEAIIGAIYMDKGYNFTKEFLLRRIVKPHIDIHTLELTETNFKSKLIEWCQRHGKDVLFELAENGEGESAKLFTISAVVEGEKVGTGRDYNKKNAEKLAAEKACETLSI